MLAGITAVNAASGAESSTASASSLLQSNGKQSGSGAPAPFADLVADAVGQVGELEAQANAAVSGLVSGSGVDVHQAVIASQKASMAFELALAVRNKAVQAYQSVIGMQF